LDRGLHYLARLLFCRGLLSVLWPLVFKRELSRNFVQRLAMEAADEEEAGDGEQALDRLIDHVQQQVEQGVRVKSTAEWMIQNATADLALSIIWVTPLFLWVHHELTQASMDWEKEQRLQLDAVGVRQYRVVNAAKGTFFRECLRSLGAVTQGHAEWALYTRWVGCSALSAFQAFRVGAHFSGAVWIRFVVRANAHPLTTFELLQESLLDGDVDYTEDARVAANQS